MHPAYGLAVPFPTEKPELLGDMADPTSGQEMYKICLEQVMSKANSKGLLLAKDDNLSFNKDNNFNELKPV